MAKSRAEIQRNYREKKKKNDPNYQGKEQRRAKTYRIPASALSNRKLQQRREKNKEYCKKYRKSKKKLNKSVLPPICILEDSTPSSSSKSLLRSSGSSPIIVKFDFQQRKNVSKRRSTALRNARNENTRIEEELRKKSTLAAKWKKKFLRLKTKESEEARKKPEAENRNIMTPNSKTNLEIRSAGISPKQLPNPIVKQLQFKNCLLEEIKDARKENKTQTDCRFIDRIISGSTIKKYKCSSMLSKALSINRKRLINSLSKRFRKPRQRRLFAMRNLLREKVESFLERDDISRCMPGKNDSIKVGNEKRQTRILNDYLRNVHEKFIIENKDTKISCSSFCK
jgi:hypothetical protein